MSFIYHTFDRYSKPAITLDEQFYIWTPTGYVNGPHSTSSPAPSSCAKDLGRILKLKDSEITFKRSPTPTKDLWRLSAFRNAPFPADVTYRFSPNPQIIRTFDSMLSRAELALTCNAHPIPSFKALGKLAAKNEHTLTARRVERLFTDTSETE